MYIIITVMTRTITNLNLANGRNIRNLPNTVSILGTEPVEVIESDSNTKITVSLKGLSGFTADKIIKVNSAGDALEYVTETDTVYTLQSPLSFISTNKIQLQQTLFNISTSLADGDYIPIFDVDGNFDRITFSNLKAQIPDTNTTYTLLSPLSFVSGTSNTQIQLDQSLFNTQTLLNTGDFFPYFDTSGNFDKITFSNLKALIDTDTTYSLLSPLSFVGSTTQIQLQQSLFNIQTILTDNDYSPYFDTAGNFDRITMTNMRSYMTKKAVDFGTDSSRTVQRVLGNATYSTQINGSEVIITNGTYRLELNTDGSFKYKSATKTLFGSKPLDTIVDSDNFSVGCPSFLKALSLNTTAGDNQWNSVITLRKALNSNTTAYSIRIYDYVPLSATAYQYFGIFSNNNVGDQASPTCPFQIRNDGYIELKANFTNNITNINNLGNTVVPQLKYIARSTTSSYHPMQQMGLASGASWTRWNYSVSGGGTDYGGIAYSFGNVGLDCISWDYTGNFWYTGALNPSDKRIKKDIIDADLDECITVMKSIKLKKYKYTDAYQETYKTTKEEVYGFLADDIIDNEYLNYCGNVGDRPKNLKNGEVLNDFKTIEKSKILTVLWGCCNSQQNKIEEQQTEIELLKSEIANIKSHLNL